MASIKLKLNKSASSVDGTYPLVFQLLHDRRKKLVYTKYRINESDLDLEKEIVLSGNSFSDSEALRINKNLNKMRKGFLQQIKKLDEEWGEFTVHDIVTLDKVAPNFFLLKSFDIQISRCEKENRIGIVAAYKSTKSSLSKFLKNRDVALNAINRRFVLEYESFLLITGVSRNTIAYYLRNLRTIYNLFTNSKYRLTENYPFSDIRTSPSTTPKRALSKLELLRLSKLEFGSKEKHLEQARDIFLFSFYTRGMSLVDILFLKKDNIKNNSIYYNRAKTKQSLQIRVTEPLNRIIDKYATEDEFILPILNSTTETSLYMQYRRALTRINRNLKTIGTRLNLSLTLTTYVARHSWATQAKVQGAPISVISEGLGHTSEAITRIYLKELDSSIIDKFNEKIISLG